MKKELDFTKPITTRDGRKIRILCTDGPNKEYPIVGYVDNDIFEYHWKSNGSYLVLRQDSNDLINPPIKRKVEFWVNVYPDGMEMRVHKSKERADEYANHLRTECLHFIREYEEGEGL